MGEHHEDETSVGVSTTNESLAEEIYGYFKSNGDIWIMA